MSAPQLSPINVTQEGLSQIHQQNLTKRKYNNHDTENELINIFGGIDGVMTYMLSSDDFKLKNHRLTQIDTIIASKSLITNANDTKLEGLLQTKR